MAGLNEHFTEVSVETKDCPDLTAAPFHLATSGLNGSQTIVEVGGPPFLVAKLLYTVQKCILQNTKISGTNGRSNENLRFS